VRGVYTHWPMRSLILSQCRDLTSGSFLHHLRKLIPPTFVRHLQLYLLITPLIPHQGVLNVTRVHVDPKIAVPPPKVVAPPLSDAAWSVDLRENH